MMDNLKLQELVRQEAGDLFDVCDGLPISCKQAVTLAMVHVAKAVEESLALDGIDCLADRPLRDAEAQLLRINDWLYGHVMDLDGLPATGDTATMAIEALEYMRAEIVTKDAAWNPIHRLIAGCPMDCYEHGPDPASVVTGLVASLRRQIAELNALAAEKVTDLQRQLDAAHATPKALNVTIVPGLPGTWNPNTEVR